MTQTPDDQRFSELFGFSLIRPSPEIIARANEVNSLFDALADEVEIQSLAVFRKAGKEEEHRFFLSNVANCPSEVLETARKILAPDSAERCEKQKRDQEKDRRH
ncbi:MAG TPA: hypothetical protein VEB18_01355 [Candidatus Paceibacterota bacterium]|nr:hypothetical protein [Candidatus Paceibacterota bacterium]